MKEEDITLLPYEIQEKIFGHMTYPELKRIANILATDSTNPLYHNLTENVHILKNIANNDYKTLYYMVLDDNPKVNDIQWDIRNEEYYYIQTTPEGDYEGYELVQSVVENAYDRLQIYLMEGWNPNFIVPQSESDRFRHEYQGYNLLEIAASQGYVDIVKLLSSYGATVTSTLQFPWNREIVDIILESSGINQDNLNELFYKALLNSDIEYAVKLKEKGAMLPEDAYVPRDVELP